ncbi:Thioredoxin-like superfamily [Sesbania bispinosa]|nr:Thioredoxin-like superfamily [Sesbania bispinosa]
MIPEKSQFQTKADSVPPPPLEHNMRLYDMVQQLVTSKAVVVFSANDCCMSIVVKHLLFGLGVGPMVVELDEHVDGSGIQAILCQFSKPNQPIPAIFIGGKFFGGVESLITYHVNGKLVPLLKEVGALWL